ncbi:MurR/RpiR family transcriptional regulator [Novispirillum itersonii]|uniref:MurR/RpiR family transcriptional regulator n=1 Tax=Novispirillum itersonii TaxID=189 RepID=UPI00037C0738|nr:SIS domain-containing protein [Novispirillum itersonii]
MLDRLRQERPQLSPAEQRVADYVLDNPQTVMRAAVADIARQAGVSQPTVIRFCRRMGCQGLPDFKLSLAGTLASETVQGTPYVHSAVNPGDDTATILGKLFDSAATAMRATRDALSVPAMEAAIAMLTEARRIEFYGLGNSGIVAADAQHKFFRLGIPSVAYTDSHTQVMAAAILQPGDCVVALSQSGRSPELLDAADVAKSSGATVIALTTDASPLARLADVAIGIETPEDTASFSPMLSRLLTLAVIDVLTVGVALRLGPDAVCRMEQAKRSLQEKRLKLR